MTCIPGKTCIGVGLGAFIVNDKREVLLMKRGPEAKSGAGEWWKPGGTMEFGGSPKEDLLREVREELGCDAEIVEFLRFMNHPIPEENQHWVALDFIVRLKGEPKIMEPHKCTALAWFPIDDLPDGTNTIMVRDGAKVYMKKHP